MNYKELFDRVVHALTLEESRDEKAAIARVLLEQVMSPARQPVHVPVLFDEEKLQAMIARVNQHEPVQYVVGEAWFFGRPFFVNQHVLIPRPETEELVSWILECEGADPQTVWDAGTGSGCIPVTLALERPSWRVHATDVSIASLDAAKRNADKWKARVSFFAHDLTHDQLQLTNLDVIVSNPPYIAPHEAGTLATRVRAFEPALALFAPAHDALFFYKRLIFFAQQLLRPGGRVYVEMNEHLGLETERLFREAGFKDVELKNDLSGKHRMLCARQPG